ncbi:uncharacterized protein BJ171DRAFT_498812 [Polychytrium aggregatum]|uniref:uncharacterized protein n=1 Tax=Polychytrium aggregatum TaxID=110093 RepID=UPI0022FEAC09|nr:uncharacterized protein BJ171DRAFT_498812 [Polychytrium aggregatum]KAI9206143.1 hypothetical protein BJ171DRAFT_498812 [Polychytrium aggregatum]
MLQISAILVSVLAAFASLLAYNTYTIRSHVLTRHGGFAQSLAADHSYDELKNIDWRPHQQRMIRAIQHPTISSLNYPGGNVVIHDDFVKWHAFLEASFPLVYSKLNKHIISNYSLVFEWRGTAAETTTPILLTSHQDVVPVEDKTLHEWKFPPFAGMVDDEGWLYGRGTLDVKNGVMSQLEAVEYLLSVGYQTKRSIWLAYGHDEEIGGMHGARYIAEFFKSRGTRFDFIVDEGLPIVGDMDIVANSVASIGIAERGYCDIELQIQGIGGHASTPSQNNSIIHLSKLLVALEAEPLPAKLASGIMGMTLESLIPFMTNPLHQVMFANQELFEPLLLSVLDKPAVKAMLGTTMTPTILTAGTAHNVIAQVASANINVRTVPGESCESTQAYIEAVARKHKIHGLRIAIHRDNLPSPVSSIENPPFRALEWVYHTCFQHLRPSIAVAPGLMLAGTDSKHYEVLTDSIYRFMPVRMNSTDLVRIHGVNERIHLADYAEMIRYFAILIQRVNDPEYDA